MPLYEPCIPFVFIYKRVYEYLQTTLGIALAINLARSEGEISRRKDILMALQIKLIAYHLQHVRLKHDDMNTK
jgi:hypothetical protein